mmetsp:Transcript_110457/g.293424  ORF Transcript_110457/g.293424 Transcript_110457/m.293424 type:complete len:242 (-) Transcript_110457:60-785(-)|eukprot:CAMPEP_0171240698 /NCGR_PEP_ID=MMETSP0790-20130122/44663_1 /TAXON_ID=2925 /ORGANISM="Alexandrium catenella, Strain OF101" /LENGTH=241 /DNA_ID=CAMNT_0011707183 /DNA_START=62 /DNA_END=787 /DNA_ORIENTATION=-
MAPRPLVRACFLAASLSAARGLRFHGGQWLRHGQNGPVDVAYVPSGVFSDLLDGVMSGKSHLSAAGGQEASTELHWPEVQPGALLLQWHAAELEPGAWVTFPSETGCVANATDETGSCLLQRSASANTSYTMMVNVSTPLDSVDHLRYVARVSVKDVNRTWDTATACYTCGDTCNLQTARKNYTFTMPACPVVMNGVALKLGIPNYAAYPPPGVSVHLGTEWKLRRASGTTIAVVYMNIWV